MARLCQCGACLWFLLAIGCGGANVKELKELKAENVRLQAESEKKDKKIATLQEENVALKATAAADKKNRDELKDEFQKLEQRLTSAHKENGNLRNEKYALESKNSGWEQKFNAVTVAVKDLEASFTQKLEKLAGELESERAKNLKKK